MNVGGNSEKEHFFTAVWNAAGEVIHSDPCQDCFNGPRSVKACLARVCCPRPSENYPLNMAQPLLIVTGQGHVTEQPRPYLKQVIIIETEPYLAASSNQPEVDSGPHSILALPAPYESFDPQSDLSSVSLPPLQPFSSLLRYFKLPCRESILE